MRDFFVCDGELGVLFVFVAHSPCPREGSEMLAQMLLVHGLCKMISTRRLLVRPASSSLGFNGCVSA